MSTFLLKMIGLVLMVLDHIGLYFPGAPVWFRMLGRACYPLFLFCMVWGLHYTKNRKIYLLRLYGMSVFMTVFCYLADTYFAAENSYGYGNHNIFLSMFLVGVMVCTIEQFQRDPKKGAVSLALIFASQLLYAYLPSVFPILHQFSGDTLTGIIPNLALNEYMFEFVALGALMYFLKERRELFCAVYILFCIYQFSAEMLDSGYATQWMMILALPLMLAYNRQKGPGMKYFFYFFYPAHTFLLFYLANHVFVG